MEKLAKRFTMENVRIGFRNFAGRAGMFNNEGDRSFVLFIEDDSVAKQMEADGWVIKWPKERTDIQFDEEDTRHAYLPISVSFKAMPPKCVLIHDNKPRYLTEPELELLDQIKILDVDVTIRPYFWSMPNGDSGVKAYLESIYITMETDPLMVKYGI